MTSPVYPPNMVHRLASIRAALNVGLVVRLTREEMADVVSHLEKFDMVPIREQVRAADIIRAFRLDRVALTWDTKAGDFQWMLVPGGANAPVGEMGGAATVVAVRWGPTGNARFEEAGVFLPSSCFLSKMADECECRASGAGVAGGSPALANFADSTQN